MTNLSKKRSYSAINLKNITSSNDELINESFRKSIANLIKRDEIPEIRSNNQSNEIQNKLKRNKSLIEIKREKWQKEREELKDSESWYSKFDSFKKKPIDRSRSQPNILNTIQNYDDNFLFNRSVSRLFSPVSNFDDESIALSNYTAPNSALDQSNDQLNDQLSNQLNNIQYTINNQLMLNHSTNSSPNESLNQSLNQPRKSFHRYAHQFNNINILEKRRKQQEYQAQLEAQLADKRREAKLTKYKEILEDQKLEKKIQNEQVQLRKEFEIDHKGEFVNKNEISLMKRKDEILKGKRESKKVNPNLFERLEIKSKELSKIFKEASTQTDNQMNKETLNRSEINNHVKNDLKQPNSSKFNVATQLNNEQLINNWPSDSTFYQHTILQPVRTNRSAMLKNNQKNSKPKWTKQVSKKGF